MKLTKYLLGVIMSCAVATTANASVMDQIGAMDGSEVAGGAWSASQNFDTYDAYDIVAVDNFTLGSATSLTTVSAVMGGWNGYGGLAGIDGYTVSIFSSLDAVGSSIFGDVVAMDFATASVSADWAGAGDHISFDLGGLSLDAGDYWFGITATNNFAGGNGQTGIDQSTIGDGSGAQGNANGGFGFGPYQLTGANYAYSIGSGAIPAPGALALLGIAGIAARRRRK